MEPVSMNNLFNSNGKINWFGWIVFIGTLIIIGYTLYQCFSAISADKKAEEAQSKKIMELEMNLREIRGNQYKEAK